MTQGHLLGGRYQVAELLGYGGMAEVHRGRDLRLGRDVAIKTLRNDLARDATFQLRFRREAQNAAALNHPAIVAVYDTGEERGQHGEALPYIIMEYVNGKTLKEVLGAEGQLSPRRAMELTSEICSALEFSHRHGIIHRDIKPGNVMLTQTSQVKVMDFGIARALASGATTMTQTSAVIGTAQYLSPEQARGESVDARSDVYATGCVLFELVCGQPPFVGDNPVSVAYQHVREDARPPSSLNPDVPPSLDAIVLKALAKNPLNRYQSAGEMRGDLLRAVAGKPVSATPVLTEDQMTAMLGPAPTTPVGRSTPTHREVTRAMAVQRQRRRNTTAMVLALTMLGMVAVGAVAYGIIRESQRTVPVPSITGMTEDEAERAIRGSKFVPSRRGSVTTAECTVGRVTVQDPTAGTEIREGETVSFDICSGPGMTTVPPLVGLTRSEAEKILEKFKLVGEFVEVENSEDKGKIIEIDPDAGTQVRENSTVTVKISKGNRKLVPQLIGMSQAGAIQELQARGFTNYRVVPRDAYENTEVGNVVGQDPTANTEYTLSSLVTIYVGRLVSASPTPSVSPSRSASPSPSR